MADELYRCLHENKGYISGPFERELVDKGVTLITDVKNNMKPKVMKIWDRLMLRKRFIIKTVFNQLKNISQIEHSQHRSCISFVWSTCWPSLSHMHFNLKKPSIKKD